MDNLVNQEIKDVASLMRQKYGMEIAIYYNEDFLNKSLANRMTANMLPSLSAYLEFLLDNREEAAAFYRSLNINYSAFFREPFTYALLEHILLPQLVEERAGHGELRVWVTGCAAGQEAYSLAILLDEINAVRTAAVPYRIFDTDISEEILEIAQAGIYETDAVLNVRHKHLLKYARKHFREF